MNHHGLRSPLLGVIASVVILSTLHACASDEAPAGSAAQVASLTRGRRLELLRPIGSGADLERVAIRIGDDPDGHFATLQSRLSAICTTAVGARSSAVIGTLTDGRPLGAAADELAHALCMGHQWMNLATAPNSIDVFSDGAVTPRPALDVNETPTEQITRLIGARGLEMTLPVPSNQSAATLAYLAVERFQHAAITGAQILELAPAGRLSSTVRAAAADGSGLSDDPSETTPLATVVVFQTAEATHRLVEAATLASGLSANEAQARLANRGGDLASNSAASWSAPHDSRSEIVATWVGSPDCSCCAISDSYCVTQGVDPDLCDSGAFCSGTDDYAAPSIDDCACCAIDPATCPKPEICDPGAFCDDPDDPPEETYRDPGGGGNCTPIATGEDRQAVEIVSSLGVLPPLAATDNVILDQLAAAVRADDPTATAMLSARALLQSRYGISSGAWVRAVRHVHERVRALGLPLLRRAGDRSGLARYDGLRSQPTLEQLAAYTAARTIGENRFDYREELDDDAAFRDGGRTDYHFAPFAYARQGVLPTLDVVASALRRALSRSELAASTVVAGRPEPDGTRRAAMAAMSFARRQVPQRVRLRVGTANADGVDQLELVVYGTERAAADYSLVVGEAGLYCATVGSIGGRPCDLADYRVSITPSVLMESALNGIGARHLVFAVTPSSVPVRSRVNGRIPPAHFYLIEQQPNGPHVLTTFTPIAGPDSGTYTRTTFIPVAGPGIQTATAAAIPSVTDCEEPRLCCDDLPCEPDLPRESELVETRYSADAYESIDEALFRLASDAAMHADALGVQAIQQELEADAAAHAAAAGLEQLCGGIINVDYLSPLQCASDANCAGGTCVGNLCTFPLDQMVAIADGPDTSSIEACLGGDLVHVNFGSQGRCYFQAIDPDSPADDPTPVLPPCVCLEDDVACASALTLGCPRESPASDCAGVYPSLSTTEYAVAATLPLDMASGIGGGDVPPCHLFAELRAGATEAERVAAAEELLDHEEWLSQQGFAELGERIGYIPGLFQMGRVTLDGATWYATGNETEGPTEDAYPCQQHPMAEDPENEVTGVIPQCSLGGGADLTFGWPLLCGAACEDPSDRLMMNSRLMEAATLIAILGGASGRYLERPGLKEYEHEAGFELSTDWWSPEDAASSSYDNPFSGWVEFNFGANQYGQRTLVADRMLFRACVSPMACGTANAPTYDGIDLQPAPALPSWLVGEYGVTGQIITALDDANLGDDTVGLGAEQPSLVVGDDDRWWWWPLFQSGTDPENQREVRCVRVDGFEGDFGELAFALGARCPTLFASIPADFESLGVHRTEPNTLLDFWDHTTGDGYTLRELLMDVAHRNGGISRWSPVPIEGHFFELRPLDGNGDPVSGAPTTAPYGRILDALELACLARADASGGGCPADVSTVPQIQGPEDFVELERTLECAASAIEQGIQQAVLFDVPVQILSDVEQQQVSSTYPELRGDYGVATAQLRSSIETVTLAVNQMAAATRQLSTDIEIARHQLELADLETELSIAEAQAQQAANVGGCVAGAGNAAESLFTTNAQIIPALINLVTSCVAQAYAAKAAFAAEDIQQEINNAQGKLILLDLQASFGQHLDTVAAAGTLMIQGYSDMQVSLTNLESIRNQASSQAMVVLGQTYDPVTGRENNYLQAQRRWTSLWLQRYAGAWSRARRSAWYARHALEARIGMDLSQMTSDLALVEAPADWADTICTMRPIDYGALRDVAGEAEQNDPYTNGFISDYVRLLGLVKDSYPFDFPYQNEADHVVLSMRDEIFDEVVQCDVEGHNLLLQSANPSVMQAGGLGGWVPAFESDGYGIDVSPIPGSPFATFALADQTLVSKALGGATAQVMYLVEPAEALDPLARRPSWRQTVSLPAGRYLLSWSEQFAQGDEATCAAASLPMETLLDVDVDAATSLSVLLEPEYLDAADDSTSHPCWRRVRVVLQNPASQEVSVGLLLRAAPAAGVLPSANWAAPQLEQVALSANPATVLPTSFFPTDDDRAFMIGLCEDWTGAALREHFTYECEPLCPPEFGDNCSAGEYCYWESNFALNIDSLMTGESAQFGGIAARSYDHRLRSVAVNLVGTEVRDCERSSRPSVCYASGFLPYSLRAEGGSFRNHFGEMVTPPYDPANVEFARALASERYITNPISGADASLLEGYWRRTFSGYPLSSLMRLRIVDVPELRWDRVRDIQLLLEVSQFTHQR